MKYRTSFQCPDTGHTVIAHYAFGKIMMHADDGGENDPDTLVYVKKHNGKKFRTFDAADHYIIHASQGQTFGFEIED